MSSKSKSLITAISADKERIDQMNLTILFEDPYLIICEKPPGIASQSDRSFQRDMTDLIKLHLRKEKAVKGEPYLGIIHRLDRPVGGIMVYAKTPVAAAALSDQIKEHKIIKKYYAILTAKPQENTGFYIDYLESDPKTNSSYIVSPKTATAKKASLRYEILQSISYQNHLFYLAEVLLETGRHHQIRVQFSSHGCPLWGDAKYNPNFNDTMRNQLGLYSHYLKFQHPFKKNFLEFSLKPHHGMFSLFFNSNSTENLPFL